MKKLPLVALLALGCSREPPCVPESVLDAAYERAAYAAVDSGKCKKYERIEECPAYIAVEAHYSVALETQCQR